MAARTGAFGAAAVARACKGRHVLPPCGGTYLHRIHIRL